MGGHGFDNGVAVTTLADGYAVIGEYFGDLDFGTETFSEARGAPSAFVARVDAHGDLPWARTFEPTVESDGGRIHVRGIAADGERLLVSGGFAGEVDFGTGPLRADRRKSTRALDGFVVALDLDGEVLWARALAAWGNDLIYGVDFASADGEPQVVVGGHFDGVADLGFGGDPDVWRSGLDACFVAKLPAGRE